MVPTQRLSRVLEIVLAPANFFAGKGRTLRTSHVPNEQCVWKIFQGHLLAASHTRETRIFQAWSVYVDGPNEVADTPLISLRWDAAAAWLYVVRNILSHCWETYESRPNVIESRPVKRWLAELVASIPLHEEISDDCLTRLLQDAVTKAVEGVSRLPITSLESPLPAFTFGEMAYFPTARQANSGAVLSDPAEVIDQWWAGSGHSSAAPPPPSGAGEQPRVGNGSSHRCQRGYAAARTSAVPTVDGTRPAARRAAASRYLDVSPSVSVALYRIRRQLGQFAVRMVRGRHARSSRGH